MSIFYLFLVHSNAPLRNKPSTFTSTFDDSLLHPFIKRSFFLNRNCEHFLWIFLLGKNALKFFMCISSRLLMVKTSYHFRCEIYFYLLGMQCSLLNLFFHTLNHTEIFF